MKKFGWILVFLVVFSCQQNNQKTELQEVVSNAELQEMYASDQADRRTADIDWSVVSQRDQQRQQRVNEMLDSGLVRTSADYAHAAMIFQHGADTVASGLAVQLMKTAIALDSSRNKWLLAAAIDRDLMRKGKPQIYGTQYRKNTGEPWQLYTLDTTQVTDAERIIYGVETLAEQREKVRLMNKKKLNELLQAGKSVNEIIALAKTADLYHSEYNFSEREVNTLGYQLLGEDRKEDALLVFKLNTELYPEGFNTFDSYGECLVEMGQVEEGILAYKKSLELNPQNDNAKKVLTTLEN